MSAVVTRLHADVEMPSLAWQWLAFGAQQLDDPETQRPFRTSRGSPLLFWTVTPGAPSVSTETVLFVGGTHADEVHAIHASFRALFALAQEPSKRPAGTRVVFVPLLNPDGILRIESFPKAEVGSRKNGNEVDLNRNLSDPNPETETRFLKALVARFSPSHVVSLHGPYGWLDYDGPADAPGASAEVRAHRDAWLARTAKGGKLALPVHEGGEALDGSLGTWAGTEKKLHVLTFELPAPQGPQTCAWQWAQYGDAVLASLAVRSLDAPITK